MKYTFLVALMGCFLLSYGQERPNIIWINCDDLGAELACYGNPDIKTPNIDQLADEGRMYTKAYANAPVCSASRSSMITGMYPVSINCENHRTVETRDLPEEVLPVVTYFQKVGYFCSNGNGLNLSKGGKRDYNFKNPLVYDGTDWTKRKAGQPFFAQIQIHYPHRTFHADTVNPIDANTVQLPACYVDHPLLRADWALYLETIQHADRVIGQIIARLKKEGLLDNTIIFFFGDHGRPHLRDKQFLYEGGLKIPLIVRYPKMVKAASKSKHLVSLVDVAATSMALAAVPIPNHAHGKVFMGKGKETRKYVYGFRERTGDAPDAIRSVTDGRYKLIWNKQPNIPYMQLSGYKRAKYPAFTVYKVLHAQGKLPAPYSNFMATTRSEFEFYDLKNDPMEHNNLYGLGKKQKQQKQLKTLLLSKLKVFEKNLIPEKAESIAKAKASSAKYFKKLMRQMNLPESPTDQELLEYWERTLLNDKDE